MLKIFVSVYFFCFQLRGFFFLESLKLVALKVTGAIRIGIIQVKIKWLRDFEFVKLSGWKENYTRFFKKK